ncbi:hypothetical protein CHU98_g1562 [Xylaria longipes]|nr:hypothetical protein CHU98_g1562 [Xylaria longipes]
MAAVAGLPPAYADSTYQTAHEEVYSTPLTEAIELVLPPGVSQEDFSQAIEKVIGILGKDAVFTGEDLRYYVDPYDIPEAGKLRNIPSAAVCPSSVEELQGFLKVANEYKIAVWTFSRGKNLGYGGPAPRIPGCIALDLHRMNKILEVNEKFGYIVVEPGVTFGDLYTFCAEKKLKLWPSVASLGWGSVVGNVGSLLAADTAQNDINTRMEVVLANGDVVRTGQYAMTTSPSAHLTKLTFGPTIDGLFLQSNLGIVTKMGIYLTPQPQSYMACSFDMPEFDDVATIVDVFGELRRNGSLPAMVYVFHINEWAALFGKRSEWWKGEGPIPEWRTKEMQEELDIGNWTVKFGLYGPTGILEAQYAEVLRVVTEKAPTGKLQRTLFSGEDGGLLEATSVPQPHGGIRGKVLLDWVKAAKRVYESQGFDLLCDFFMHERCAVFVCMLCFDKTSAEQRIGVDKIFNDLFKEGSSRGFAKYRAHIKHMDHNAELFDFNDHAYRRFVETLKDSLDPNGILSPGKMGIWPKRLRDTEARAV